MGLLDLCQQLAYTTLMDNPVNLQSKSVIKEYFSSLGKLSASKLTPQERKDRATKAAVTRWAKVKPAVEATR